MSFSSFAAMMGGRIAGAARRPSQRRAFGAADLPARLAAREALVSQLRAALRDLIAQARSLAVENERLARDLAQARASAKSVWRVSGKRKIVEKRREAAPSVEEPEEAEVVPLRQEDVIEGEVVENDPFGPDEDGLGV